MFAKSNPFNSNMSVSDDDIFTLVFLKGLKQAAQTLKIDEDRLRRNIENMNIDNLKFLQQLK